MNIDADKQLERDWQRLLYDLKPMFKRKPNLQVMLFLIGVQELGQIHQEYSKEAKQDLMHVGMCTLTSQEGYYQFTGKDEDGWPHWEQLKAVPKMTLEEREKWLKKLILQYFKKQANNPFSV